jgi:hypothetical protein
MHSLIHHHLAHASAAHRRERPLGPGVAREQPPPGRLRAGLAAALLALGARLDREQARRLAA